MGGGRACPAAVGGGATDDRPCRSRVAAAGGSAGSDCGSVLPWIDRHEPWLEVLGGFHLDHPPVAFGAGVAERGGAADRPPAYPGSGGGGGGYFPASRQTGRGSRGPPSPARGDGGGDRRLLRGSLIPELRDGHLVLRGAAALASGADIEPADLRLRPGVSDQHGAHLFAVTDPFPAGAGGFRPRP